jgi:hypothetical protein
MKTITDEQYSALLLCRDALAKVAEWACQDHDPISGKLVDSWNIDGDELRRAKEALETAQQAGVEPTP